MGQGSGQDETVQNGQTVPNGQNDGTAVQEDAKSA
jgi:hypothetical protein